MMNKELWKYVIELCNYPAKHSFNHISSSGNISVKTISVKTKLHTKIENVVVFYSRHKWH